jgi:hypothetical protein
MRVASLHTFCRGHCPYLVSAAHTYFVVRVFSFTRLRLISPVRLPQHPQARHVHNVTDRLHLVMRRMARTTTKPFACYLEKLAGR